MPDPTAPAGSPRRDDAHTQGKTGAGAGDARSAATSAAASAAAAAALPASRVAAVLGAHAFTLRVGRELSAPAGGGRRDGRGRDDAAAGGGGGARPQTSGDGALAAEGQSLTVALDAVLLDGPGAAALLAASTAAGPRTVVPSNAPPLAPSRLVFVPGAEQPRDDRRRIRGFAREHGLPLGFAAGRSGWPAVVAADEGLLGSSDLLGGGTPDVGSLGGLGCIPLRCQVTELNGLLGRNALPVVVPATRFARVTGRLPRWVGPFDLAVALLSLCGGAAGLRGAVLELHGDTITALDVPDRLTLCGTLAAAGIASVIPPDARTVAWLAARRTERDRRPEPASRPPADAAWLELDARKVRLTVLALTEGQPWPGRILALEAGAHGNAAPSGIGGPREGSGSRDSAAARDGGASRDGGLPPIDEVVIAGRLEDLRVAAEVLRERNVHPGVDLSILPASQRVLLHAIDEGLIADFLRTGARLLAAGGLPSHLVRGDRRLVSGPATSMDLVCGPAVAAASAAAGRLIDPEGMRHAQRRTARLG
jgi:3-isopropylmalate/(R)-2-methylmalate dehydratase large subunit